MTTTNAAKASEVRLLRAVSKALKPFDTDLADLERLAQEQSKAVSDHAKKSEEHELADVRRFLQVHAEISKLNHSLEFLHNRIDLMHDQLIEGFRNLGAQITKRDPNEVTPPVRRGRNGQ